MNKLVAQALANAEQLRALTARIDETVQRRSCSAADKAVWEAACREFHARFDELFFPGGVEAWTAFLSGASHGIEPAIAYLEADPWAFRSGYLKQIVWNRLKRTPLSPVQMSRLEAVALAYLEKRVRREFWHMAKFMRTHGSEQFWQRVESVAMSEIRSPTAIRATWLLRSRRNENVRRHISSALIRAKYGTGHVPMLDVPARTER